MKTEALALPAARGAPDLARFELIVRDVLEDRAEGEEAGAGLSSGLGIAWPWDAQAIADQQARVRSALRE